MTYVMRKPVWFGNVGAATVISPAATFEVSDWWDAWRFMWIAIGAMMNRDAAAWERTR
jgi:hypothetical protein